jgi:hypothetical protein
MSCIINIYIYISAAAPLVAPLLPWPGVAYIRTLRVLPAQPGRRAPSAAPRQGSAPIAHSRSPSVRLTLESREARGR